jgi:glutathione S-transferase
VLTLYDAPRCPYCARTRIVLAEKDVPYETVTVDLADRPAWLLEHNPPDGRVPVLEEDGWILPESVVIDEFLEERYPDPPLLPSDPAVRAAARFVIFRFDDFGDAYYAFRRGEAHAERWLTRVLTSLDGTLAATPYLVGGSFGLADVSYLPWAIRLRDMLGFPLDGYPAIVRWLAACSERDSVAAEVATVASLVAATKQ